MIFYDNVMYKLGYVLRYQLLLSLYFFFSKSMLCFGHFFIDNIKIGFVVNVCGQVTINVRLEH